ncbi:MAG: FecR domain-containing protein [Polyangiales bacterium]
MDRLARDLDQASAELTPQWTAERSARLYEGAVQQGRRRAVRRTMGLSFLAAAAAAMLVIGVWRGVQAPASSHRVAAVAASAPRSGEHALRLADGSRAELVGEHSELEVTHNSAQHVGLRLVEGRAHFEVVHDTMRSFVVEAQPYRVEVIGTSFDVERSGSAVTVQVMRGKVRVYGPQGAEDLVAGQIKHFARGGEQEQAAPVEESQPVEELAEEATITNEREAHGAKATHARARSGKRPDGSSWRSLTQSGQYEAAFAALRSGSAVEDDPAALMDAADAARLSGHAQDAVQYLARVVSDHRTSPVAPLAAFTLGRVYLDKLGQPDRAAEAFGRARELAPNGSLAQDALAREVEALSKGGNAQKAYQRAQEYLRLYPYGRRLRAVQLYGGLE